MLCKSLKYSSYNAGVKIFRSEKHRHPSSTVQTSRQPSFFLVFSSFNILFCPYNGYTTRGDASEVGAHLWLGWL